MQTYSYAQTINVVFCLGSSLLRLGALFTIGLPYQFAPPAGAQEPKYPRANTNVPTLRKEQ